jgi:hypothetical protein
MYENGFTRADFMRGFLGTAAVLSTAGAAGAAGLVATGTTPAVGPDPAAALADFWTRIPDFLARYPTLPGVALVNDWIRAAPTGLTPDQEDLLRGALVLQAEKLLRTGGGAINVGQIEGALARGLAVDLPSNGYLESLLADVERRAGDDPDFALRVADAVKRADLLDDAAAKNALKRWRLSFPEIGAIAMLVLIIVIIILI